MQAGSDPIHPAPMTAPVFEAVIVPHRSLSARGLRVLVGFICVLSGGVSAGLWLVGAWPAVGFYGAEIGLAVALLRWDARRVRASEKNSFRCAWVVPSFTSDQLLRM